MQAFKIYYKLLIKNKMVIIIYSSIFLFISILLSTVLSSNENSFSDEGISIGMVASDDNLFAQNLIEYFNDKHTFKHLEYNEKAFAKALYWREYKYILIIPDNFEEKLKEGKGISELSSMKIPGNFSSDYFESDLSLYVTNLSHLMVSGYSLTDAAKVLLEIKEQNTPIHIASFVNAKQNDQANTYFLYAPYCFISVSIACIGLILVSFNQQDLKNRIECGAVSLKNRISGLSLAIFTSGLMLLFIIVIIGVILTKGTILLDKRLPFYILNMLAILLCSLSFGFMTGMLSKSREVINGVVNVVSLGLCFLGGIFVPQEFFGKQVEKFAKFMPTYWYVKNNELIGGMKQITTSCLKTFTLQALIMIAMAFAIFIITILIVNKQRKL